MATEPALLFWDRVKDGVVIYNLAVGLLRVSRDMYPTIQAMDKTGMLWPYSVRRVVLCNEVTNEYIVEFMEAPSWVTKNRPMLD